MRHSLSRAICGLMLIWSTGCMSGPQIENPTPIPVVDGPESNNPILIPAAGPQGYAIVFDSVLDVIDDHFEITYSNRWDGRIVTFPRTAPGIGRPWAPGSPDLYERWYATCQSIRHRAVVLIQAANNGDFFVDVKVFKELEDLPQPTAVGAGPAVFRADVTLARQNEVIDATSRSGRWIPIGRDIAYEQKLLEKILELTASCGECASASQSVSSYFRGVFSAE